MVEKNGNRPVKVFSVGCVSTAVFSNERISVGKKFSVQNVVLERRFKDREGNWKSASSLQGVSDLVKARLAIDKTIEFLLCGETNGENSVNMGEPERARSLSPQMKFSGVKLPESAV
jgi:hypothetical protein